MGDEKQTKPCRWCGGDHEDQRCSRVKRIGFSYEHSYTEGRVTEVEFWPPQMVPLKIIARPLEPQTEDIDMRGMIKAAEFGAPRQQTIEETREETKTAAEDWAEAVKRQAGCGGTMRDNGKTIGDQEVKKYDAETEALFKRVWDKSLGSPGPRSDDPESVRWHTPPNGHVRRMHYNFCEGRWVWTDTQCPVHMDTTPPPFVPRNGPQKKTICPPRSIYYSVVAGAWHWIDVVGDNSKVCPEDLALFGLPDYSPEDAAT